MHFSSQTKIHYLEVEYIEVCMRLGRTIRRLEAELISQQEMLRRERTFSQALQNHYYEEIQRLQGAADTCPI